jgi:hypothetical protein
LGDVHNLIEAVSGLDRVYLATWASKLGVADLLDEMMS